MKVVSCGERSASFQATPNIITKGEGNEQEEGYNADASVSAADVPSFISGFGNHEIGRMET